MRRSQHLLVLLGSACYSALGDCAPHGSEPCMCADVQMCSGTSFHNSFRHFFPTQLSGLNMALPNVAVSDEFGRGRDLPGVSRDNTPADASAVSWSAIADRKSNVMDGRG